MARKTPQEVAAEALATAERVAEKADARVETTKAAHEKAVADAAFARRRLRAARLLALDDVDAEIDPEPEPAAAPADGDDLLK